MLAVVALWGVATGAGAASPPRGRELPPLTTISGSDRLPGKFVWADLVTDNLPVAQRFYSGLFGWTFSSISPGYIIAANEERPLAGILQRPRPQDRPAQPRWFGFISVRDLRRAEIVVTNAGGRVVAPREKLPRRGEQAVFADPEGALFGVVRSSSGDPADFLAAPGDWIWVQLMSRDARTAAEFYSRVAGYRIVENIEPNRLSDFVLTSQGFARATVRTLSDEARARSVAPTWLPFVRVEKLAPSVAKVRELGGTVTVEPRPEYLGGRVAVVADPTGAAIGLLEWSDDLVKKGGGS